MLSTGKASPKAPARAKGIPSYYYWGPGDLGYDESSAPIYLRYEQSQGLMQEAGFQAGSTLPMSSSRTT